MTGSISVDDERLADEDGVVFMVDDSDDTLVAIVADAANEDAWIGAPLDDAHTLSQWR